MKLRTYNHKIINNATLRTPVTNFNLWTPKSHIEKPWKFRQNETCELQTLSQIPKPFNTVWKSIYRLTKQIWNSLPRYLFLKDYFSHEDIIDNFWKLVSPYRLSVFRISFPANLQYYDQSILQIQSLQQRSMINFWNLSQFLKNNVKISTF